MQPSNEAFPAISATKMTASQAGSPLGGLVRMLRHNCITCWQGGHKGKGQEEVHIFISIVLRKVLPFNPSDKKIKKIKINSGL